MNRTFILILLILALPVVGSTDLNMAVPYTSDVVQIDGQLGEDCWETAALIQDFSACIKQTGKTDATIEVRLLWKKDDLLLGIQVKDANVLCSGAMTHDDNLYEEDAIELFLDPVGDGRAVYELIISPDGKVLDAIHLLTAEASSGDDGMLRYGLRRRELWHFREWTANGLRIQTSRRPAGWSAELAIPAKLLLRRLGKKQFAPMTLRANFLLIDYPGGKAGSSTMHASSWHPVLRGNPHNSLQALGSLTLLSETVK